MAEFSSAMPNLINFPMEKLCYDLMLEVIEQMDPFDVIQLMKADERFRSILLSEPWRIFGKHVHSIVFYPVYIVEVCRFPSSNPVIFDLRFCSNFFKRIRSCSILDFYKKVLYEPCEIESQLATKLYSALESIGEIRHQYFERDWLQILGTFKGQFTERIDLDLSGYISNGNDSYYHFLSNLIGGRLKYCNEISFQICISQFTLFHRLLSQTNAKRILLRIKKEPTFPSSSKALVIPWIFTHGIPSQNRDAVNFIWFLERTGSFFSLNTPLLQNGDEAKKIFDVARTEYARTGIYNCKPGAADKCFRKKIDDGRDCIYMLYGEPLNSFFAKYVPAQTENEK